MNFRLISPSGFAVVGLLLTITGCDEDDGAACGPGTVEVDGTCVVAGPDTSSGDDDDDDPDAGDSDSGGAGGKPGADNDDDSDSSGGDNDEPGECVGEARSCFAFDTEASCLGQEGCYPVAECVGVEEDCGNYDYASDECEAAPHCYSEIVPGPVVDVPGCWAYDSSDCEGTDPDLVPCASYGGTCQEGIGCDGSAEGCEYLSDDTKAGCEAQQGCYWKPD